MTKFIQKFIIAFPGASTKVHFRGKKLYKFLKPLFQSLEWTKKDPSKNLKTIEKLMDYPSADPL